MALHALSWLALAIVAAALGVGWTRRFLAFGALALANIVIHFVNFMAPRVPSPGGGSVSVLVRDLGLWGHQAGDPAGWVGWLGHMFLHGSFSHLFGNMLILLVIGYYLEDRAGPRTVILAYLLTGFAAAAIEMVRQFGTDIVLIGASGADFGLLGVLAAAYPMDRLRIPVPVFVILFIQMRAWVAAIVFAVFQFFLLAVVAPYDNVAYFAHLGGLAAGIVLGWTVFRARRPSARVAAAPALDAFATNPAARAALEHMRAGDEPELQEAWRSRFEAAASCPRCGKQPVSGRGGRMRCPHCGFDGAQTAPLRS